MSEGSARVALVTGGGRGIGRATALALARAGLKVAVGARTGSALMVVLSGSLPGIRKRLPSTVQPVRL